MDNTSVTEEPAEPPVKFSLIFGKQKHPVEAPLSLPVVDFRKMVHELTNVPPAMQKLLCKASQMKDGMRLGEAKVSPGCKVMLIGSTLEDIMAVNTKPTKEQMAKVEEKPTTKEPLCKHKMHTKVIEKGKPEDVMPGIKNTKDPLPVAPLSGMRNKYNHKLRLTFKLELDQLWFGTPERTEKVPMNRISSIVNEPIDGHEEYHILGFQLGTTEASRYWAYWVPAQYVDAIKNAVLGS